MTMVSQEAVAGIGDIMDSVAQAFFGMKAQPLGNSGAQAGDAGWLTGCISIRGAWSGALTIACSRAFACRAAAAMSGSKEEDVSEDDARDAVGELTNILGGNFKALVAMTVDGSHQLSLPIVSTGPLSVPGATATHHAWFALGSDSLRVSVLETAKAGASG